MARRPSEASGASTRRSRRRSTGGGIRRAIGLLAFLPIASRAPIYGRLIWALVLDERTPASRKAILAGAIGYLVLGRDLVPDDVPIVGALDDLVVLALALDVFIDGLDEDVLEEHLEAQAIDRAAFDEDVTRLRRVLPRPIRRTFRRLPGLVSAAGEALQQSDLGPRLRAWIAKEGSIA